MSYHTMIPTSRKRSSRCLWLGAILLLLLLSPIDGHRGHSSSDDDDDDNSSIGLVQVKSTSSFTETYDRLIGVISGNSNLRIVSQIDHMANAESVGLTLGNIRLVVFGNPAFGTPFMLRNQFTGLDLPQKMLVWETNDGVFVGYNSVTYLRARHPGIGRAESFAMVEMALRNIAGAAAGVSPESIDGRSLSRRQFYRIRRMRRGLFQRKSNADFETTFNRLITALENAPPNIAFQVDHAANAPNGDLSPTRLVAFANPALGTRLMQVNPSAGVDLPLKILVTQDSKGRVIVSTNSIGFLQFRHGLFDDSIDETLTTIRGAIMNFVRVAATGA